MVVGPLSKRAFGLCIDRSSMGYESFGRSAGGPLHSDLEGVSHMDGPEVRYSQICPKQAKKPLA